MSVMGRFGLRIKIFLSRGINPVFSLCCGAAGCNILSETMWYIRVYVSSLLHFGVIFSAAEMRWLMPVLWEHTSVALRALGSE